MSGKPAAPAPPVRGTAGPQDLSVGLNGATPSATWQTPSLRVPSPQAPSPQAPSPQAPSLLAGSADAVAVVIANANYGSLAPPVDYAWNDGEAMVRLLVDRVGVPARNVVLLRDARQSDLLSLFGNERSHQGRLWSQVRPGRSDVYVFYSGHGMPGLRDRRGYLLPADAEPTRVEITGYPLDLLYANLGRLDARSVTVMLDACFSGRSDRGAVVASASPVFIKAELPRPAAGITVLAAARADEVASWNHQARLGLFTSRLVEALGGAADGGRWGDGDGRVSLGEAKAFLEDEVAWDARRLYGRVQTPSVEGDPGAILTAGVAPPGPRSAMPPARPTAAGGTAGWTRPDERVAGPAGDLAAARRFVEAHRDAVLMAVDKYYRVHGRDWDNYVTYATEDYAVSIGTVSALDVVAAEPSGIDLFLRYSWNGTEVVRSGHANMRLKVEAGTVEIVKMWK